MELSRRELEAYDADLSRMEAAAADYALARVSAYLESYPSASVADVREFAKEAVGQAVDAYGDAASAAAADLYDALAEASGKPLPAATVDVSDVSSFVDKEVRYQAGKLADGAPAEFAKQVARCASDQVSRRANATMMRNVERDGVLYARVPLGVETCDFCVMLASRGFVYSSAKSAGEGDHWHRNCRCKVIPGMGAGFTVEGYSGEQYEAIRRAHAEIDADGTLTDEQKRRAKRAVQEYDAFEYMDAYRASGFKAAAKRRRMRRLAPSLARQKDAYGVMRWADREATGHNTGAVKSMAIAHALDSKHPEWVPELLDFFDTSEATWARRAGLARVKNAKRPPTKWEDPEVSALADPDEVAAAFEDGFAATATDAFKKAGLDAQKGFLAGIREVARELGAFELASVSVTSRRNADGAFNPDTGTASIAAACDDPYLTGRHEGAHAYDAHMSAKMPGFVAAPPETAYSLYSIEIVKRAMKRLGITRRSKRFRDYVTEVAGYDVSYANRLMKEPWELFAYSMEGKGNALSVAIVEEARSFNVSS